MIINSDEKENYQLNLSIDELNIVAYLLTNDNNDFKFKKEIESIVEKIKHLQ